MNEIIKIIAEYFIILPVVAAIYILIKLKKKERIEFLILLVAGGLLSLLLAKLGGAIISDPRPFVVGHFTPLFAHATDNGFPSDHTLFGSFLGYLTLRYSKKIGIAVLIIAALIGTARVLAGVHHVADIIGSFVIAGIGFLIILFVLKLLTKKTPGSIS